MTAAARWLRTLPLAPIFLHLQGQGISARGYCNFRTALRSSLGCRAMAESNTVHTRRPTMRRATAAAAERIYREKFGAADGSVPATFEASTANNNLF